MKREPKLHISGYSDDNVNVSFDNGVVHEGDEYGTYGVDVIVGENDDARPVKYRFEYGHDGWEVTIPIPYGATVRVVPESDDEEE